MIKRIQIRDFKSIRNADLQFSPVTVLVGRSGSGKSNLIRAIRFLRNYLLNPAEAVAYEGGWHRILPAGEKDATLQIQITFELPMEQGAYQYQLEFAKQVSAGSSLVLKTEKLELGDNVLFARAFQQQRAGWVWEKAPSLASLPPLTNSPMIGQFPSIEKIVFAYAALSTGVGFYHFPSSTLESQSIDPRQSFLKALPGLADDASNYREVMRAISQDFHNPFARKGILAALKAVNPSINSIELDSLTNPAKAIVGHLAGDKVFDLSLEQESDGLRRFYTHLLALYQRPPKLSLIFEEPENAIFPGALSLLAEEFKTAPHENRGQVILTTHSPALLESFEVESVRVVEMHDGHTQVGPVSKDLQDAVKSHLLSTGELLTVEQPRMENSARAA